MLTRLNRHAEALTLLEEVTHATPDYAWAQMALGLLYFRQAQYEQAVAAYGRAVALQDDYGEAWYNLGEAHLKLNDYAAAEAAYTRALAADSTVAKYYHGLGAALYKRRDYAAAIVELQRAVALDSLFARARFNLGNALLRSGQQEEGRRQLGWFKMGHMLPELMEPLRTMDEGQLYPHPVKTQIGYHVFRLDKRRHVDFAAQSAWIAEKARVQKRADDMEQYVHRLRREYELAAHDEGLKALTAPDGEEQVLFSWRGGQLTAAAYWANLAANHSRLDSAARYKAAENLAGVQIMMAEGRKLQYNRDPEVREPVEQKRDALIVEWLYRTEGREVARQQPITEEDVRAYYDANVEMFTRTDGKVADLSLVYNSIKTLLRQEAATRAMDAFIARLREQYSADIEINAEVLAEVSLQVFSQPGEDADKGE